MKLHHALLSGIIVVSSLGLRTGPAAPVLPVQPSLRPLTLSAFARPALLLPALPTLRDLSSMPAVEVRAAGVAAMAQLEGAAKSLRASAAARKMPDPDGGGKKKTDPDAEDLDDLGNPKRRQSPDGPDDVSDEFGRNDRGDSAP